MKFKGIEGKWVEAESSKQIKVGDYVQVQVWSGGCKGDTEDCPLKFVSEDLGRVEVEDKEGVSHKWSFRVIKVFVPSETTAPTGLQKFTKEQAIVISAYTGVLACDFSDMHGEIEKRLGHPVFTHQIPAFIEKIREIFKDDFISMCSNTNQEG